MRLWHKDLIEVLPKQQLLGQVREITLIMKNINELGKPNHILVNKIMDYSMNDFLNYCGLITNEMKNRNYKITNALEKWSKFFYENSEKHYYSIPKENIFLGWHNNDYLTICYYNLLEKYMCGGITAEEFEKIRRKVIC